MAKIVIFFCMALLLATAASASRGIKKQKPVCNRIKKVTPEDLALCKKLVGKTDDLQRAIPKLLESVRGKFLTGKHIAYEVTDKMPESIIPMKRESAGHLCHLAYDDTLERINRAIFDYDHIPDTRMESLQEYTFSGCTDYLRGLNVALPELEKFQSEAGRRFNLLVAVVNMQEYL